MGFRVQEDDLDEKINQEGWNSKIQNFSYLENRVFLLELLLAMIVIDKKFSRLEGNFVNVVGMYLKNFQFSEVLIKSLLHVSVCYQENGILPYSAYLYQNFQEQELYCVGLSINLLLFLLRQPFEEEIA